MFLAFIFDIYIDYIPRCIEIKYIYIIITWVHHDGFYMDFDPHIIHVIYNTKIISNLIFFMFSVLIVSIFFNVFSSFLLVFVFF